MKSLIDKVKKTTEYSIIAIYNNIFKNFVSEDDFTFKKNKIYYEKKNVSKYCSENKFFEFFF